jgi:hypothetical protein
VKWASTEWKDVIPDLVHKVPRYLGVFLGKDNFYSGWNG